MARCKAADIKVYIADINALGEEEVFLQKSALLCQERRSQVMRYRSKQDRMRGLGAGLLLEYGLRQWGLTLLGGREDRVEAELLQGAYGKPYLAGCGVPCFNLSHAGAYVAAVFAECEVGIDIERIRPAKHKVAKRFFLPEEYEYLMKAGEDAAACDTQAWLHQDRTFTRMWTRKESYIKAVGEGMRLPLTEFSVLGDVVIGAQTYYLRTWDEPEGYALSVCARTQVETQVQTIDLLENI